MDECLVCRVVLSRCIPDIHPYRITNTKCHINTAVSPDDGHIIVRNMSRKEINTLRKIVHQVASIDRIIQRRTVNKI